jgi:5-formyltetrahydrofolate cyclo-ligase
MELAARKATIRRLVLSRRGQLDPDERVVRGNALIERLLQLPEVSGADPVLAFMSISSEVPTTMLLEGVLARDKRLLLPYVADDGALRAAAISSLRELEPGYRGIPEPRARLPIAPDAAGVVIVPGVAFDERGGRLGYGGGFYDVFLRAAAKVPRIGICFEMQIVDEIPVEDHDQRVDLIVTEERVIHCERP